jgi:hypothetical protein
LYNIVTTVNNLSHSQKLLEKQILSVATTKKM